MANYTILLTNVEIFANIFLIIKKGTLWSNEVHSSSDFENKYYNGTKYNEEDSEAGLRHDTNATSEISSKKQGYTKVKIRVYKTRYFCAVAF